MKKLQKFLIYVFLDPQAPVKIRIEDLSEKCKQIYANGFLAMQHIWYESSGPRLESQTNCSEILQPLRLADIFQVACIATGHMMMQ